LVACGAGARIAGARIAGARIGFGLPAVLPGFAVLAVDRRSAFFAGVFAGFFRRVAVLLRAALPIVRFLLMILVLRLTFFVAFFAAIAAS